MCSPLLPASWLTLALPWMPFHPGLCSWASAPGLASAPGDWVTNCLSSGSRWSPDTLLLLYPHDEENKVWNHLPSPQCTVKETPAMGRETDCWFAPLHRRRWGQCSWQARAMRRSLLPRGGVQAHQRLFPPPCCLKDGWQGQRTAVCSACLRSQGLQERAELLEIKSSSSWPGLLHAPCTRGLPAQTLAVLGRACFVVSSAVAKRLRYFFCLLLPLHSLLYFRFSIGK